MIPTLATQRLLLRQARLDDEIPLAHFLGDIAVSGNLARVPHPYHRGDARAWLRSRRADLPVEETNFTIEVPGVGLAGHVGFHRGAPGPVIGYWLGRPFWGQGLMTEAVAGALDWFFAASPAPVLYSGVFHFNAPSLAIQHKLGFTEIGRSRLHCLARGLEVEHIDTQLLRGTWQGRQP